MARQGVWRGGGRVGKGKVGQGVGGMVKEWNESEIRESFY